jgi:hypothetical protein
MKTLTPVESAVLLNLFRLWAQANGLGDDLQRAGTISPRKRWCALWQALNPPLTLNEIAIETKTGVSAGTLAQWRREPTFRNLANAAAKEFADHLGREVTASAGDGVRRLFLTSLWVRLPGFGIPNPLTDQINAAAETLRQEFTETQGQHLHNLLVAFRDVLELGRTHWMPHQATTFIKQARKMISPVLHHFIAPSQRVRPKEGLGDDGCEMFKTCVEISFLCANWGGTS